MEEEALEQYNTADGNYDESFAAQYVPPGSEYAAPGAYYQQPEQYQEVSFVLEFRIREGCCVNLGGSVLEVV